MLVFIRVLATNETFGVELDPSGTVKQIRNFVTLKVPELEVGRIIFQGQILNNDDAKLYRFRIRKESIVQVQGRLDHTKSNSKDLTMDRLPQSLAPPLLGSRQVTVPEMSYGDVLLFQILEASHLRETYYFSQTSNPYAVFAFRNQVSKSSVKNKQLNPKWNETFGFLIGSPGTEDQLFVDIMENAKDRDTVEEKEFGGSHGSELLHRISESVSKANKEEDKMLSVMIYSANYKGDDVLIGSTRIDTSSLVREKKLTKWFDLDVGTLHLKFRRRLLSRSLFF